MKFTNKKKEPVQVTYDSKVYTVEPGAEFDPSDDNEELCQAALDAGLETHDKLNKKDEAGEKKGGESETK